VVLDDNIVALVTPHERAGIVALKAAPLDDAACRRRQ